MRDVEQELEPADPEPVRPELSPQPPAMAGAPAMALQLQRQIGNRATNLLLRQSTTPVQAPAPSPAPPVPRPDYVFIMGQDKADDPNKFYAAASGYWHAHLPKATFVPDKRNLADVLTELAGGTGLIGNIYIVSHANEDG